MTLPVDINNLSTQELNALAERIENTLAQREREDTKAEVIEVNLFGEKSLYTSAEKALKELVDYVSEDDFSLFKGVGYVTGVLPYVEFKQKLVPKNEFEKLLILEQKNER